MDEQLGVIIHRLSALSPLPSDDDISEEQLDEFSAILDELQALRDVRCVSPLLQALGYGTGYGLYWNAVHFLETFEPDTLHPHLVAHLQSDNPGSRMWSVLMLGRTQNVANLAFILPSLSDKEELVRLHAVSATVMLSGSNAKTYVAALQDDPSSEVCKSVRKVLNS